MSCTRSLVALLLLLAASQEKKDVPKPVPRLMLFMPLGVAPGTTATVTARGMVLDQATELRIEGVEGVALKIKSKGKAAMPKDVEPAAVGDTQMELEITLPAEAPEGRVSIVAVTPLGSTEPHPLLVLSKEKLVPEKEPNGAFTQAQPLESGKVIVGAIAQPKDVDVFKVKGQKGEAWTFEAIAQRLGSHLDPTLSLYTESGQLLATRDDDPGARDATLRVTLPADGVYYLSLIDAHDLGDAMHVYHLHARRE